MSGMTLTVAVYAAIAVAFVWWLLTTLRDERDGRKKTTQKSGVAETSLSSASPLEVIKRDPVRTGANEDTMFEKAKLYDGVPPGAVFESLQRALRTLEFKDIEEDPSKQAIRAKCGYVDKSSGTKITLGMRQLDLATQLTFSAPLSTEADDDCLKSTFNRLTEAIDVEIESLYQAGRILRPAPVVYSFETPKVQEFGANESGVKQKPEVPETTGHKYASKTENKTTPSLMDEFLGRLGSIAANILGVIALVWLMFAESGPQLWNNFFKGAETDIAKYDCEELAKAVSDLELQNGFGATFKIISYSELREKSRSQSKLVCTGLFRIDSGEYQEMDFSAEKSNKDGEVLLGIFPI
jgi:hypothetical protein